MTTKVQQNTTLQKLPAGLIGKGEEAFWVDDDPIDQKWLVHNGIAERYCDLSLKKRNEWAMHFRNDTESRNYIEKKLGITGFWKAFNTWWKCVIGGIDSNPDMVGGTLIPDIYNNMCTDYKCEHRGHLCSVQAGLKYWEISTLNALKIGLTVKQTAPLLNISEAGLKSRIQLLKIKLDAKNERSLIAKATELGI